MDNAFHQERTAHTIVDGEATAEAREKFFRQREDLW
jgi:hypothetical protein